MAVYSYGPRQTVSGCNVFALNERNKVLMTEHNNNGTVYDVERIEDRCLIYGHNYIGP